MPFLIEHSCNFYYGPNVAHLFYSELRCFGMEDMLELDKANKFLTDDTLNSQLLDNEHKFMQHIIISRNKVYINTINTLLSLKTCNRIFAICGTYHLKDHNLQTNSTIIFDIKGKYVPS